MVEAARAGRADVHARALAHRLQSLQDLDLLGAVFPCRLSVALGVAVAAGFRLCLRHSLRHPFASGSSRNTSRRIELRVRPALSRLRSSLCLSDSSLSQAEVATRTISVSPSTRCGCAERAISGPRRSPHSRNTA